ncbi:reverse transcriptase domain-containing protein [Tanacetum coccineum]
MWLKGRVNKDRQFPGDEIRSVGDKLKETEDKIKEGTLKVDHGTDAMTVVLGKKKGGYARGVGSGVIYKRYFDLPQSRQASDERIALLQSQLDNERREHQEKELEIQNLSNKMSETEGMVSKLMNQLAAQRQQLQTISTKLTPSNVSSVDINPIHNSADEEGRTPLSLHGCENDASIQKSNGLATSEKEMETRASSLHYEAPRWAKRSMKPTIKVSTIGIRAGGSRYLGLFKVFVGVDFMKKRCVEVSVLEGFYRAEGLHKYRLKCFLDAYKGYHQIFIAEKDEEKTAFFTREGVFCYKRLPFGLKNARATYQKLIDKVFSHQMGRNMKVNADDMVIKSVFEEEMMADIIETLEKLRAINLKLNPKKRSFGVEEGLYSGHLITKQGIRADPSKVKAVSTLSTSGKIVQWTKEADEAFQRMKECLESLPTMVILTETLTMYLETSEKNVSVVLMEKRGKKQIPIYFVSRTLHGAELKNPELEKLILTLVVYAARKLRREILANFLAETPLTENRKAKNKEVKRKELKPGNAWKLFTDGASSSDGSRAGMMLVSPEGKEYTYALRFEFVTTNNEAEYEALLAGLRIVKEMEIRELIIFVDSQLVANQVKWLFEARQPTIKHYLEKMMNLLSGFPSYSIEHIKREQNKKTDALGKLASMTFSELAKNILVEVIQNKSITEKGVADVAKEKGDNWMTPIREYPRLRALPDDPQKARKLLIKAPLYKMIEEKLYRRSYLS